MNLQNNISGWSLRQKLLKETRKYGLEQYILSVPLVVGVSGGADSLSMLHMLLALRGDLGRQTLHVAHLNHWIRGKEAHEDAEFVEQLADQWGLECTLAQFDVPNYARRYRLSVEEAARRARYAFFAGLAQERGAAIAVAHNADDQVETVLLSILRGTGLHGLAGMQMLGKTYLPPTDAALQAFEAYDPTKEVPLFRPLLGLWRWQILEYCKEVGLEPRWDSTNWERHYKRNRVRHDLVPLLQVQYSLAIKEHLYNLSMIAQGEDDWLTAETSHAMDALVRSVGTYDGLEVPVKAFAALRKGMQRRVTRQALLKVAGTERDFTFKQVEAAAAILAGEDGSPRAMHLPHGLVVGRDREQGYVRHQAEPAPPGLQQVTERPLVPRDWEAEFEPEAELALESGWRVESSVLTESWLPPESLDNDNLTVMFDLDELMNEPGLVWRTRLPGDYLEPMGLKGNKRLQDVMVDAKIPRGQRDHTPILAFAGNSEVLWVPGKGGRRSLHALVSSRTKRVLLIRWVRRDS